jgi:hypothetical protein
VAAEILTITPDLVWSPPDVQRLWFFPHGSQYLRYSPHFHMIARGGFRQNFPLNHMFILVLGGKLSVKDHHGFTVQRIDVRDQVWYVRGTQTKTPKLYASTIVGLGQVSPPFPRLSTRELAMR